MTEQVLRDANDNDFFDSWIKVKKSIHDKNVIRTIHEGEIWWCGMGKNVGVEINGKNERFSRPILIIKKLSRLNFLAVPLTSQQHVGSWYTSFTFQGKIETASLSQIRTMSTARLYKRIGTVPDTDLQIVKNGLHKLYFG